MEEIEGNIPSPGDTVPNNQYDSSHTIIATFNNAIDVDNFFNSYNQYTNYNGLMLGQIINIKFEFSTISWYIAGFNCEDNHKASDGTIKDNGPGICLIPVEDFNSAYWNSSSSSYGQGYLNSKINIDNLPSNSLELQKILEYHLVNRNVLLSSSRTTYSGSTGYTWTTSYLTLFSGHQLTGNAYSYSNQYDNGEANYKLPLFNYMTLNDYASNIESGYKCWLRGIVPQDSTSVWGLSPDGSINSTIEYRLNVYRPMIYIR